MRCSIHSIKRVASHLITPVMRMVFNPTQLKTVTMEGESGTNDVRNAVYADSSSIVKEMQSSSKKDGNDYMNDPLLQELEYKTSYAYCCAYCIHPLDCPKPRRRLPKRHTLMSKRPRMCICFVGFIS